MRIAVIGLGLIGGSVAAAVKDRAGATVAGYDIDVSEIALARDHGIVDVIADSPAEAVAGADVVFVAVPVGALQTTVADVLALASEQCVVTDVGSTKRILVPLHGDQRFVGGHPLAGAETAGVRNARADLFEGATWYLTPTATTSGILYERLYKLISAIGARPVAIDADAHDRALGLISHLPHVLANVLVSQVADALGSGGALPAVGPSFRDATRVAGSNTAIWADIYLANRDALAAQLDETIARLKDVRSQLSAGDRDAIAAWNERSAGDRRRLLETQSSGDELHELRVPVPNRPGVVAEIALALGRIGVNIADLALYPAPDMSDGVVALWIAGSEAASSAQETIEAMKLTVFRP
jgi:prephenate dehydrogenase